MKIGLYKIYDTVSDSFGGIQEAKTLKQAIRSFHDAIKQLGHPEDFELWRVGFLPINDDPDAPDTVKIGVSELIEVVDKGKSDGDYGQAKLFKEVEEDEAEK
jgi:hypothetical protein